MIGARDALVKGKQAARRQPELFMPLGWRNASSIGGKCRNA